MRTPVWLSLLFLALASHPARAQVDLTAGDADEVRGQGQDESARAEQLRARDVEIQAPAEAGQHAQDRAAPRRDDDRQHEQELRRRAPVREVGVPPPLQEHGAEEKREAAHKADHGRSPVVVDTTTAATARRRGRAAAVESSTVAAREETDTGATMGAITGTYAGGRASPSGALARRIISSWSEEASAAGSISTD